MLDIGAGSSATALAFKESVRSYLAVEKDKRKAESLRSVDIPVINKTFPCSIKKKWTLVLLSHSIPENKHKYHNFIKQAWDLVSENGYLIIITFKGVTDSLRNIKSEIFETKLQAFENEKYIELIKILELFGKLQYKTITSIESSTCKNDIYNSVLSSLKCNKKQKCKLTSILEKRYRTNLTYKIYHKHNVLILKKHNN